LELTRMIASRALRCVSFLVGLVGAGAAFAATPGLVVDVDTGKVLYAERATDPWFPASITKLMTTYVALDMVRSGRASMDKLLTMSEEAAAQPPSKMGFRPGTQITLENALRIIMVKSANDVAQTIAENLGGSVEGFAGLMNEAAQRLGMRESRWVNPHGLPDDRQQTSARDMAILGRALIRDFPDHSDLFRIGAIRFGRSIMRNHNGLLGRYAGVDGMKTGFICSGGFNVVASANQNGRRLITVVLGSSRANERNLRAAELFDRGFAMSSFWASQTLDQLPASSLTSPPNLRPYVCERRGPVPSEDDTAVTAGADSGGSALLASAFGGAAPARRTELGPRAYFEPIRVWIGPTPPTAVAGGEDAEAKAARRAVKAAARVQPKSLARNAKTPAPPASASAYTAAETPAVIDEGKRTKPAAPAAALAVKPKAAAKPAAKAAAVASPAAKPAARAAAAAAPKPRVRAANAAAKPAPAAQAKVAAKPKPKPAAKPKSDDD
jgi:D-alanyl-D-alanine carboxypeptidase